MGITRTVSSLAVALLFLAASAAGQDRAGFTGTWTRIDPERSANSSDVQRMDVQGLVLKMHIDQKGSAGPLGYGFVDDRTYTIDGPVESKTDDEGRVSTVSLHREGPNLVFVRTTTEGLNVTTEREVWSVSADGTTLTKARETTDWRGTKTGTTVYQRTTDGR